MTATSGSIGVVSDGRGRYRCRCRRQRRDGRRSTGRCRRRTRRRRESRDAPGTPREAAGQRAGRRYGLGDRRTRPRDGFGHRLVPRHAIEPQHRRETAHAGHRIEHAGRAVRHQHVLREIPIGFLILRELFVGDRDQDRREQRKAAPDPFPPHAERAAQCAIELRARVAPRISVRDRELQEHAEQPLARRGADRSDQQRLDRNPRAGDEHRRQQRMPDPERELARGRCPTRAIPTTTARARVPRSHSRKCARPGVATGAVRSSARTWRAPVPPSATGRSSSRLPAVDWCRGTRSSRAAS